MADHVALRPLAAAATPALLALLDVALGRGAVARTPQWWQWKHAASPFGPSPGVVAMEGDEPVALRVFLPWRWRHGDRTVEAMRPVDTATHPRWQRQGLFRRLTEALVEEVRLGGADLLYNTPNTRSGRGYREMGWSTVGRIPVLLRVPRAGRLVRRLLGRADGRGQAPPLHPRMGDGDEQSFALDGLPSVAELLREDALAPFLAALWPTEQRLHTGRTPDYLAWRYADAPAELGYRALWRFAGDASALVIARPRQRRGLREAAVVEVLAAEGERGTAAAAALLAELARAGADYLVATAAARSSERAALARTGFMKVPAAGRTLMARPLAPAAADATDRRSWRLQLGDLELF